MAGEITWDSASDSTPSGEISWDQPEEDKSLVGQAKEFGRNLGGLGMAAADMAASIPGLVGAGTAALQETATPYKNPWDTQYAPLGQPINTGRSPTETVGEVMQSANEGNPLNYLPESYVALRNTEGYRVANKYAGLAFSMVGQGWGNIAAAITAAAKGDEAASKVGDLVDAVTQTGLLVGGVLGAKGAKPGTLEFRKATEPTGVNERLGYGPAYDPSAGTTNQPGGIDFETGPKRDIVKSGVFDKTLTTPDMPAIEPETTGAYTYKNKTVLDKLNQYEYHIGSDLPGIDFNNFKLEDPEQLANLQTQLGKLGITADINQARTLATQMEDKAQLADERVKGLPHTISRQIPPTAIESDALVEGYKAINASPMNAHVELVPTPLMELMRDHDRLTEPKGRNQFLEKERSVLANGIHKGLPLYFWPEEGRIVQVNGNTRRGVAAKHGVEEIPAYVRVMKGKVPEEWQRTAVSIPGLSYEGEAKGQFVKPSEIGLPSRTLNEGVFDPKIKYAPEPTVDTVKIPAGQFQNNHLFSAQHNFLPQYGARKGLSIIRDTSSIPFYRELSRLLLSDDSFNPDFAVREKNDPGYSEKTGGQYRPKQYEMSVRKDNTGNEYVFMHEAVHARVHSLIQKLIEGSLDRMHPAYDATKRLVELWQNLSIDAEIAKDGETRSPLAQIAVGKNSKYGLTDPHEFVAEAFTNPEFQNLLKQISLPDHLQPKSGFEYYWDRFVNTLSDLIGVKRNQGNYLAATLQAGAEMMRKSTKQDRMFYALEQHPANWYPRNVGVEGNFIGQMKENKVLLGLDRRPLQEVVKDKGWTAENFKDLDVGNSGNLFQMLWGKAKLLGRQMVEERTVALLNKSLPGTGDLLRNIADRTFLTDRWVKSQVEETTKGKEFGTDRRGFAHRYGSRDGIDPTLDMLGDKEASKMFEEWLPKQGNSTPITRSAFGNDKRWNAYNIIRNQLDRGFQLMNDLRMKVGLPAMEARPNYFPASREVGDYRVVIKDAMGNEKDLITFKRSSPLKMLDKLYAAQKYVKAQREKFPYLQVSDPIHVDKKHLRDINGNVLTDLERILAKKQTDYDVWAEAERINNSNDPVTRLVQQAKIEHFTKQGMGGHLLPRKLADPIGGYLGSDFNARAAREGLHQYFEYLYNYAGNLQKTLYEKELNSLEIPAKDGTTKPLSQVAPNLDLYLHQVMDAAKGKHNTMDMSEQIFLGEFTRALGEGESAPTRGMAKMSRAAMVWYLFKPAFFGTQPLQVFNSFAHMVRLNDSFGKSSFHWLNGLQETFFPPEDARQGVNWAVKNGYIDPTTAHLLDDYNSSVPTRVFLKTTGTIEREGVRIPSFLQFNSMLRETIKDPETRYQRAAEEMAYSMSMVNRSNSPLIWEKLGIIGQGMRALKSYSTNIWGQFAVLVNEAHDTGRLKPLGAFIGVEALVGGIKGVVGIAEVTALINLINYQTNSNIPTPVEWLLTHGAPDAVTYGLASSVTGRDISNQVGNPSGFNILDPIPFKFAADIAVANKNYAVAVAQNQLKDDIRLQTWLANTPSVVHEAIRNAFTRDGQPVPTPGNNMEGNYFRDTTQTIMSTASGTRSIEETHADDLQRMFKQHEQRLVANKAQVLNSMTDDMLNGHGLEPSKIQEYAMQGGDLRNLSADIKQTIIERHRSNIFNQIIHKTISTSEAQKLQAVQPYLANERQNIFPPSKEGTIQWDDQK